MKTLFLGLVSAVIVLAACGESENDMKAELKRQQDSINAVIEQAKKEAVLQEQQRQDYEKLQEEKDALEREKNNLQKAKLTSVSQPQARTANIASPAPSGNLKSGISAAIVKVNEPLFGRKFIEANITNNNDGSVFIKTLKIQYINNDNVVEKTQDYQLNMGFVSGASQRVKLDLLEHDPDIKKFRILVNQANPM